LRFISVLMLLLALAVSGCAGKAKSENALEGRYILALSHLANNDPTSALNVLIPVVEANPRKVEYQEALAYAFFLKKAYPEAERHYLKALRLSTDGSQSAQIENNLGSLYLEMRRWDEALVHFRSAASSLVFQTPEVALSGIGTVYLQRGQYIEAVEAYRDALRRNPNYSPAYFKLAEAYRLLAKPELAVETYEKLMVLRPNSAQIHYQLGMTWLEMKRAKEAKQAFEAVLKYGSGTELGDRASENLRLLK